MAWHNGDPIVFGYPRPPILKCTRWMIQWTHSSWLRSPHFIEIDEDHRISYNGNVFHGTAEYQHHPQLGEPRIGLQFSPVHNARFLRRFVFIHIAGTANYLYEHGDNYSCILMQFTHENNCYKLYRVARITPTTLDCVNPQKKRRIIITTDEEEEDSTFREFQQAQDDFVEASPTADMKAITLTAANLKDQILRSTLCRQPESRERADNIIVDNVMSAAAVEQKAAETKEGDLIPNKSISSEPIDPDDLD